MNRSFWKDKKILVTGARGFVGSHIITNLLGKRGVSKNKIRYADSKKNDLKIFKNAFSVMDDIDLVIHLAADVGGVGYSNTYPATQFKNCMLIDLNVFEAAVKAKVKKIIAVSSSVAYPVTASSPLKEEELFEGMPAKSGYGYGFAKRCTIVLARAYNQEYGLNSVVLLPNNAYGPGEKVDLDSGHVIPSIIYKCLKEKSLTVWGDGTPIRDFLHVEDFAEGVLLASENLNSPDPVNLGSGVGISIKDLVKKIIRITKFKGKVEYDTTKPNGQKERIVDISKARKFFGFSPKWTIDEGLENTVMWIKKNAK